MSAPSLSVDVELRAHGRPWWSMAPGREHARGLAEIAAEVAGGHEGSPRGVALAGGLAQVARAIATAFPDNLFWDLDHLAARLWHAGDEAAIDEAGAGVVALIHAFGRRTSIAFRYVHDFLYGFDWAKWVARDPGPRAAVGPFDAAFVAAMTERGHELRRLIATGEDLEYPPLADERARNPFGFSREPADELSLHRHLARHDLVPLAAWRIDAQPRWDRPYSRLRAEAAKELGLGEKNS